MERESESLCDQPNIQIVQGSSKAAEKAVNQIRDLKGGKTVSQEGFWDRLMKIPALGVILGVLSSFIFSVAIMLVKVIKGVDPMYFVICRGILQFSSFNAIFIYQQTKLEVVKSKTVLFYLLLTACFGSLAQVLAYGSIAFIPLGDATAVLMSAPVFVSFFACVLLKEKCGPVQFLTVIIAVTGVVLICRPTFIFGSEGDQEISSTSHIIGTSMVAAGCLVLATFYVALRKISYMPMALTNSVLGLSSIIIGAIVFVAKANWHVPNCGTESLLLVVSASSGSLAMLLFVMATKVEEAGPLSVVRTSEIIFAFMWQMGLLGHTPSWTTLAGAGAIVSSVIITGMQKYSSTHNLCASVDACHFGLGRKRSEKGEGENGKSGEQIPMKEQTGVELAQC